MASDSEISGSYLCSRQMIWFPWLQQAMFGDYKNRLPSKNRVSRLSIRERWRSGVIWMGVRVEPLVLHTIRNS